MYIAIFQTDTSANKKHGNLYKVHLQYILMFEKISNIHQDKNTLENSTYVKVRKIKDFLYFKRLTTILRSILGMWGIIQASKK